MGSKYTMMGLLNWLISVLVVGYALNVVAEKVRPIQLNSHQVCT